MLEGGGEHRFGVRKKSSASGLLPERELISQFAKMYTIKILVT
jgi:hypothetical protein